MAALIGTAGLFALARSKSDNLDRFPDDAPGRTARQSYFGNFAVTGKTVTIGKPRHEVYDFYRNFGNLARFMENITSVRTVGDLCHWEIDAPGQSVEIVTRIVSDRAGEEIAWSSTEGSQIETRGKVLFRDAPGERGTEVEAIIAYDPPAGTLGRMVAKLFQREPSVQGRRDLKRLKMIMETGEIATNRNRKTEQEGQ
ncbi:cyclase [Loktanella sp. M215]|nr:cyclase [Loktanella sp. M215]